MKFFPPQALALLKWGGCHEAASRCELRVPFSVRVGGRPHIGKQLVNYVRSIRTLTTSVSLVFAPPSPDFRPDLKCNGGEGFKSGIVRSSCVIEIIRVKIRALGNVQCPMSRCLSLSGKNGLKGSLLHEQHDSSPVTNSPIATLFRSCPLSVFSR